MGTQSGFLSSVVVSGALAMTACGGSGAGAKSASDAESESGVGKSSEPAAPRVLKSADEPSGVVAKMRITNMAAIADSVLEAASIPLDWRRLMKKDRSVAPYVDTIDWEGSIEGVMAMNLRNPQRPHGVLSVGVTGIERVLDLLERQDIVALEGPGEVYYFELDREDCAVGPAIKGSPARVVCSERRASLDLLLPYALRGMPQEELSDADLFMEFDMEPLRATYGKELKTYLRWAPAAARSQHVGNPTFDRALSDGAAAVAREGTALIDELNRITIEASQESGNFSAAFNIEFQGGQSDTVKILKDLESRQKTVPKLFDELPSTASAAGYSREMEDELTGPWMSIVADLVRGGAELEGASKPFAKRLGKLIERLGPQGQTGVYARGPLVEKTIDGETKVVPAWVVSGTTQKKAQLTRILDDVSWLLASRDWKKLAKDVPHMPSLKKKAMRIPGAKGADVYEWNLPPEMTLIARALGAQMGPGVDSDEIVDTVTGLSTGLIAIHEMGGRTWISWGQQQEELAESFRAIANQDSQKLASLGGLGGVRSEPAVSAGYAKLEGLVGMAAFLFPAGALDDWDGLERALPNGGDTPVIYSFRVKGGSTTTASWEMRVPVQFTQDLAALSVMLAKEKGLDVKELAK